MNTGNGEELRQRRILGRWWSRKYQESVPPLVSNTLAECVLFGTLESVKGLQLPGKELGWFILVNFSPKLLLIPHPKPCGR